jgi:ketosteroid isomerase-like protein
MRKVAAAFERADLQPLFDAIDEKIVWKAATTCPGLFRFSGEYQGAVGVTDVISNISKAYSFRRYEPKEFVSNDDVVWGLFEIEADYHPPGDPPPPSRLVKFECAVRWRVRNDKIVEHQSFFDTASLLLQQGELPRP